ncbi:MAG: valine--tRNA ligase, partial [Candidatus Melainabacteria bacterium HGW-Melainabacteria-1]
GRITQDWLENIRDWCISRQLWWGHQIPVWYDADGQIVYVGEEDPSDAEAKDWVRDADVLDTWFSSALWPFATLGWPERSPELDYFHPTDVLSTARDIINLWVVRMIFSSQSFMQEVPFKDVLIHATILTKDGKRMSKSKGTGLDPLEMFDKYGADACRFWLAEAAMSGQDVRFSDEKLESSQFFVTKIWNASRFVLMNLDDFDPDYPLDLSKLNLADRWILSRLRSCCETVSEALNTYQLSNATRQLYSFIWSEFCDWYLEIAKPRLAGDERKQVQAILFLGLDTALRLLHPFMPFVSEELWSSGLKQVHPGLNASHLIVANWPDAEHLPELDPDAEREMELLMETIRVIRNLRMEVGVPANKDAEMVYLVESAASLRTELSANAGMIARMAKVSQVMIVAKLDEIAQAATGVAQSTQVVLPLAGLIDLDKERERLQREIGKLAKEIQGLEARLGNPKFRERAPEDIVAEVTRQRDELQAQQALLSRKLDSF